MYARELRISLVHKDQNDDRAFIRGVYWEGIRKGEVRNDESSKQDIEFILQNEMKQSSKKK